MAAAELSRWNFSRKAFERGASIHGHRSAGLASVKDALNKEAKQNGRGCQAGHLAKDIKNLESHCLINALSAKVKTIPLKLAFP